MLLLILQIITSQSIRPEYQWKRNKFTLDCLLPQGWLTGSIISVFTDLWQPDSGEGILIVNTYLWPKRLASMSEKTGEELQQLLTSAMKHRVWKVGLVLFLLFWCYIFLFLREKEATVSKLA